uniref:Elongator complex protein 2 n=1 Tax=Macrostomum lignano TaxID=282301 RepID=A0A1I8GP11_9PLAT
PAWSVSRVDDISLGGGFAFGLRLIRFNNSVLLAYGDDDGALNLAETAGGEAIRRVIRVSGGHQDWVRDIDWVELPDQEGCALIATASQDSTVRLWRLERLPDYDNAAVTGKGDNYSDGKRPARLLDVDRQVASEAGVGFGRIAIRLESVLQGHDSAVTSVRFFSVNDDDGADRQPQLRLLTSSMDRSLVVWQPQADAGGLWLERDRVGSLGGNQLGFLLGLPSPPDLLSAGGQSLLACGFNGALSLWTRVEGGETGEATRWRPLGCFGGHSAPVESIAWSPGGAYLLSASSDQTCRAHGPCRRLGGRWGQLARPQVHGYDMTALAFLDDSGCRVYASAAEEKPVRLFRAPNGFRTVLAQVSNADPSCPELKRSEPPNPTDSADSAEPEYAQVPSLGLSNQPMQSTTSGQRGSGAADPEEPPSEDALADGGLWPEVRKLFGHGGEVQSLAACPGRRLLAAACRATQPDQAGILVWRLAPDWSPSWRQTLEHHGLTVAQLAFDSSGRRLLAVSRDRGWSLWRLPDDEDSDSQIQLLSARRAAHARIVWSCAWPPTSADDEAEKFFATGSRDRRISVWLAALAAPTETKVEQPEPVASLELDAAVTALSFRPTATATEFCCAAGLESGAVALISVLAPGADSASAGGWRLAPIAIVASVHAATVRQLAFRPGQPDCLASCSADATVRLLRICRDEEVSDFMISI